MRRMEVMDDRDLAGGEPVSRSDREASRITAVLEQAVSAGGITVAVTELTFAALMSGAVNSEC
jgi:hypothetical protein